MQYYMDDEKWKLSRDDPNHHSYAPSSSASSKPSFMSRSVSQRAPASTTATNKPSLVRNLSLKNPSLSRSSSQKSSASSGKSSGSSSSQKKCSAFTKKFSNLAKEQRAKFYIVKRCITLLVRGSKNGDS